MQEIVCAIFEQAKNNDEEECEVVIACLLLPPSYVQVPGMFGKSVSRRCVYPSVKSSLKGEYIIVTGSDTLIPSTFRARVLEGLRKSQRVKLKKKHVPVTYRRRPDLLAKSLSITLVETVRAIKKPNYIIWKIA